jgi:hypothetical protein
VSWQTVTLVGIVVFGIVTVGFLVCIVAVAYYSGRKNGTTSEKS